MNWDGDVIKTTVLLGLSLIGASDNGKVSGKMSDKPKVGDIVSNGLLVAEGGNRNRTYKLVVL